MKKLLLGLGVAMIGVPAYAVETKPFDHAEYAFAVQNITRDGKIVRFTIPENAREIDKQADAVRLSGLYTNAKPSKPCPVVSSYDVSKDVKDYNLFSGKADITATFDDEAVAKAATDSGCLLIDDPD